MRSFNKNVFLRCDSHSDTNLSGILLVEIGQTLPNQALILSIATKKNYCALEFVKITPIEADLR